MDVKFYCNILDITLLCLLKETQLPWHKPYAVKDKILYNGGEFTIN